MTIGVMGQLKHSSTKLGDSKALHYIIYRLRALCITLSLYREEVLWLYQEGASHVFPDEWDKFIEPIPKVERGDLISAYHRRLTGDDEQVFGWALFGEGGGVDRDGKSNSNQEHNAKCTFSPTPKLKQY